MSKPLFWNADDASVIACAVRYQVTRRERGDALLPIIFVPLYCSGPKQPDTAEVDFSGGEPVVTKRFQILAVLSGTDAAIDAARSRQGGDSDPNN